MPASNAFTGFTANGQNGGTMNVDGTDNWDTFYNNFGHNFWTSSSKTATINFPNSSCRYGGDGSLINVGRSGYYWSAVPHDTSNGCDLFSDSYGIYPLGSIARTYGYAARPVSE